MMQDITALWRRLRGPVPGAVTIHTTMIVHLYEAGVLLATNAANQSVGMWSMLSLLPESTPGRRYALALILLFATATAFYAMHDPKLDHLSMVVLLLPQQSLLLAGCFGAGIAGYHGYYADGYTPGGEGVFITTDQIWRIVAAPAYTWALWARARYRRTGWDRVIAEPGRA